MLEPRVVYPRERRIVETGEIDPTHLRTQRRVHSYDLETGARGDFLRCGWHIVVPPVSMRAARRGGRLRCRAPPRRESAPQRGALIIPRSEPRAAQAARIQQPRVRPVPP